MATRRVNGQQVEESFAAPCVGDYTHIRPKEDRDILDQVKHVPVRAGSAVFWDNRIPHANSYRHCGDVPRCVVYCSFLPDVPINREYVQYQLRNWRSGKCPTDRWIEADSSDATNGDVSADATFTALGRRLMGLDEW